MVDFRKWLIALAAVALLFALGTPANAQQGFGAPFVCVANAGDPHIVRVEGITELVGDIVLQCSGGIPTPLGKPIPQTNVTLTLNTNITSRLLGGGFIDALLAIDEPVATPSTAQNPPTSQVPQPVTAPPQNVCSTNTAGGCNAETGTNNGIAPGLPGANPSPYQSGFNSAGQPVTGQPDIFVAIQTAANQVVWLGVPIDAPGTVIGRTIRITNVRANACQLGLSSTLIPTQIVAFISVNGSANLQVNNPQQTVAFIQQGLIVGSTPSNLTQCNNLNVGGGGNGGNFFAGSGIGLAESAVNLREGFAASFKRRGVAALGSTSIDSGGATPDGTQNVLGFNYNNERGFQPTGINNSAFSLAAAGGNSFGQADNATRFLLRFNNVGVGVRLILPVIVPLTTNNGSGSGTPVLPTSGTGAWTGGVIRLVGGSSDVNGNLPVNTNGFTAPTTTFGGTDSAFGAFGSNAFKGIGATGVFAGGAEITGTGGTVVAVYEVVNEDPSAVEQANIPIGVAFISNTAQNIPAPGQTTINASFAPLSNVGTASGSAPIPRFCDQSVARNIFNIVVCQCNLLFPFVTNQAGFDTGIALANTTVDPYGTTPQNGTVSVFYFGNTAGGGAAPTKQVTQVVPAGQELIFNLSGGGNFGMQATPGFQGYIITIANFQFCHAFAFISDVGATRLAEGYLAIQLDVPGLNRTGIVGENEGH